MSRYGGGGGGVGGRLGIRNVGEKFGGATISNKWIRLGKKSKK